VRSDFRFSQQMNVFWDVAPYGLVEVYWCFRGACCLHHHCPDDGGSEHLWNVGKFLPIYTMQHPRRQSSSIWGLSSMIPLTDVSPWTPMGR
jgi:hypothetical protein